MIWSGGLSVDRSHSQDINTRIFLATKKLESRTTFFFFSDQNKIEVEIRKSKLENM